MRIHVRAFGILHLQSKYTRQEHVWWTILVGFGLRILFKIYVFGPYIVAPNSVNIEPFVRGPVLYIRLQILISSWWLGAPENYIIHQLRYEICELVIFYGQLQFIIVHFILFMSKKFIRRFGKNAIFWRPNEIFAPFCIFVITEIP